MNARLPLLVLGVFTLAGCGGDSVTDAGLDAAHVDVSAEAASDGGSDTHADARADAYADAPFDEHPDADRDAASRVATGTLVPLYTYPSDAAWNRLAAAARAHPSVRVVAVINPNSGPTATADPAYTSGIAALQSAGITVVAYVPTGYGARAESAVDADADLYRSEYPTLDGIFFDEAAIYETGHESLYAAEAAHARARGFGFLVANPGTAPLPAYVSLFDVSLVYESAGTPTRASLDRFAPTRTHCGIIPYAVATLDPAYVASVRPDVQWVYVTDDDLPNPWDSLPPYFEALMTALE